MAEFHQTGTGYALHQKDPAQIPDQIPGPVSRALADVFKQVDDTLFLTDDEGKITGGDIDYFEAYQGLEDCLKAGLVKSISISNYNRAHKERHKIGSSHHSSGKPIASK